MLWAPFSGTSHYHNRNLARARKQRTKKNPKADLLCPWGPYLVFIVYIIKFLLKRRLNIVQIQNCYCYGRCKFFLPHSVQNLFLRNICNILSRLINHGCILHLNFFVLTFEFLLFIHLGISTRWACQILLI